MSPHTLALILMSSSCISNYTLIISTWVFPFKTIYVGSGEGRKNHVGGGEGIGEDETIYESGTLPL